MTALDKVRSDLVSIVREGQLRTALPENVVHALGRSLFQAAGIEFVEITSWGTRHPPEPGMIIYRRTDICVWSDRPSARCKQLGIYVGDGWAVVYSKER